jgi:thiol-disulfide isomerase/thioredoxin
MSPIEDSQPAVHEPTRSRTVRFLQISVLLGAVAAITFMLVPSRSAPGSHNVAAARRTLMPDFTLPDLHNHNWNLAGHRGRVVLVNFWATWCPPCREEIPGFIHLAKSQPELDIVGVAMDEGDQSVVRRFVMTSGVNYAVLLPPASSPFFDAIDSLPTTFLVDKQGRIARKYSGEVTEKIVRDDVAGLLAER